MADGVVGSYAQDITALMRDNALVMHVSVVVCIATYAPSSHPQGQYPNQGTHKYFCILKFRFS
jgi:hypothetical protein